MGYTVELSFDLRLHQNSEECRRDIILQAEKYNCEDCYWVYEIEGAKQIDRNHCVIIASFNIENIAYFVKYLRVVSKSKKYYIESIYDDNHCLIFASNTYLNKMDRDKAREFKARFRNKKINSLWSKSELNVIKAINIV